MDGRFDGLEIEFPSVLNVAAVGPLAATGFRVGLRGCPGWLQANVKN